MWKAIIRAGMNLVLRACMGVICIYLVHIFAADTEWAGLVGINQVSIIVSAILGMPGLALLYGFASLCKL